MFYYLKKVRKFIELQIFKIKWKLSNRGKNHTTVNKVFDVKKVSIGKETYGNLNIEMYKDDYGQITIGNYCSIGDNTYFICGGEHNLQKVSTFPFSFFYKGERDSISKGPIIIEDDVWIGFSSIILSGVRIGQGAVVAAGSVVTKDVPPYSIVGGNPARIIRYRFDNDIISKLIEIDYSRIEKKDYKEYEEYFNKIICSDSVDNIISHLPKKMKNESIE